MTKPIARDPICRRRAFDADVIALCVRWYLTYRPSYRDLVEMMAERGIQLAHTTVLRWVTRDVPEFEKRWKRFSKVVGSSWRVDETYISIKAKWHYPYRAVDKHGKHDHRAIKRRCASMAGFKSFDNAAITIAGIELAHRIRKNRFSFGRGRRRRGWSRKVDWAMALA
jgi:transposase-like protein